MITDSTKTIRRGVGDVLPGGPDQQDGMLVANTRDPDAYHNGSEIHCDNEREVYDALLNLVGVEECDDNAGGSLIYLLAAINSAFRRHGGRTMGGKLLSQHVREELEEKSVEDIVAAYSMMSLVIHRREMEQLGLSGQRLPPARIIKSMMSLVHGGPFIEIDHSRFAVITNRRFGSHEGLPLEALPEICELLPENARVLDLGAGGSSYLEEICEKREDIRGVKLDIAYTIPGIQEHLPQRRDVIAYVAGRLEDPLPFCDNSFDMIIATWTLEYLSYDDRLKALKEINRVRKPSAPLWCHMVPDERELVSEMAEANGHESRLDVWAKHMAQRLSDQRLADTVVDKLDIIQEVVRDVECSIMPEVDMSHI